jgi:hypothetical protein
MTIKILKHVKWTVDAISDKGNYSVTIFQNVNPGVGVPFSLYSDDIEIWNYKSSAQCYGKVNFTNFKEAKEHAIKYLTEFIDTLGD